MILGGFWKTWWAFGFLVGPFVLAIFSSMLSTYISIRHLNEILNVLKNSRYVVIHGAGLRHQGWLGRHMLIAQICGVVLMPWALLRKGELNPDDLRRFPLHLKRLLKIKTALLGISVTWALLVYVLSEFK